MCVCIRVQNQCETLYKVHKKTKLSKVNTPSVDECPLVLLVR